MDQLVLVETGQSEKEKNRQQHDFNDETDQLYVMFKSHAGSQVLRRD